MHIIVTGPKGAGKTTNLITLCSLLKKQGKTLGGVISRRVFQGDALLGYEIVNPGSGDSRILCTTTPPEGGEAVEIMGFCHYQFRRSAFAEGNQWIAAGLAADVLFIDEVGNIELGGSGWDVERALARKLPLIFGVREDTVPNLEGRWGITWPRIHINPGTDATEDLMKMLMA